jgi:RecG-like helicase
MMISGVIENYDKSYFVLQQILPDEVVPVDTILVLNGKFSHRLKSNQAGVYLLQFNDTLFISFIANPGDKLVFYADANNLRQTYDIQGNEETRLLIENQRKLDQLYQKTKVLSDRFIQSVYEDNFDSLTRELDSIYAINFDNHKKYLTDFILSHPDKLASLMAFYQLLGNNAFFSMEEDHKLLDTIYPILSKTYPKSIYIDDLKEKISKSDE